MRFHWHSRDVWRARTGQAECKNLGCAIPGTAAKAAAKAGAGSTSCSGPASRRSSEARAATPATTSSTTRSRTYSWAIRPCRRNSAGRASCRSTTGTRSASPHIAPCQPAMRTGGLKVHRRETSQSSCLPGPTRMPSARRDSMSCNFASPARVGSRGPKSRCWCPRSPSGSARRSRCPRREFRRALALRAGRLGSSISVSIRQSSKRNPSMDRVRGAASPERARKRSCVGCCNRRESQALPSETNPLATQVLGHLLGTALTPQQIQIDPDGAGQPNPVQSLAKQ